MTIKKELQKLTLPIFIDVALVMLLGAVDTIMLSRYSDEAVAAVGLDNQLLNLVFLVFQFVSMGVAILCAQYIGAKLQKRLVQVIGIALVLNTLLGVLVSGAIWLWAEPILRFMGLREGLMPDGLIYLKITGALSFFQAISLTLSASLRSADKVVWPMIATAIVNVLNIVGNYALIFGHWGCPALGVEGSAWATAGSRVVATFILLAIHFRVHIKSFPLEYFRPFPWQELKNLLHIGIPAMSEELSYCLSQVVVTYFINEISTEALATRTYCWTAMAFTILICVSVTQGGSIIVGHLVGQLKYRVAYALGNYMRKIAMIASMGSSLIMVIVGYPYLSFLTDNPTIITLGVWVFVIDCFLQFGRVRNIFACGTLRSAGDAVYPVIVGVIVQWTVAVGFSYFLGVTMGLGLLGMWVGFATDENIRGVILMRRWHSKGWVGKSFTNK